MLSEQEHMLALSLRHSYGLDKSTAKALEAIYTRETGLASGCGCLCSPGQRNQMKTLFFEWYDNLPTND